MEGNSLIKDEKQTVIQIKTTLKKKTDILVFVAALMMLSTGISAAAQDYEIQEAQDEANEFSVLPTSLSGSMILQYSSLHGTGEIVRASGDNSRHVTCAYVDNRRSLFIVTSGNTRKTFYTSEQSAPLGSGEWHEVLDMLIDGSTCWVCGRDWHETGQLIYNLDGSSYWERVSVGFIGRFDIDSILGGSGTFYTYPIANTTELTHIARGGYSLAFIADGGDCAGEAVPAGTALSLAKVTPPKIGEVFMDVVFAGGKYVFLSRFHNIGVYYNRYRIGLRYAAPGWVADMQTMHVYDTWELFFNYGWFAGLEPVHLCKTNSGNGVAVSWVETDPSNPAPSFFGHLFVLKIDSEGAMGFKGYYSADSAVYTRIKDVGFGGPSYGNPYMTLLLEDADGNSVFRFINTNCGNQNICSNPMLSLSSPRIESAVPIQTSSTNLKFIASGFYDDMSYKIAEISEINVIDHSTSWQQFNCMSFGFGEMYSDTDNTQNSHSVVNETDNKTITTLTSQAVAYTLTIGNASATIKCLK